MSAVKSDGSLLPTAGTGVQVTPLPLVGASLSAPQAFRPAIQCAKDHGNLPSLFIAGLVSCRISELNQLLGKVGLMSIKTGIR